MGNDVCRACGACCASLRVGFAESETTRRGGTVPYELTEPWIPRHRRMGGTAGNPPRCVALEGRIGQKTSCTIYGRHPAPCRELVPSTPDAPNPWCDQARAAHGLPPLTEGAPSAPKKKRSPAPSLADEPSAAPPQPAAPQPAPAAAHPAAPPAPVAEPAPAPAPPAPPEGEPRG